MEKHYIWLRANSISTSRVNEKKNGNRIFWSNREIKRQAQAEKKMDQEE